ncbi:MAG: sigma-70 family RNA polymerase sigma factor [Pirellulales bacterium]|nr:sigma-70 family RNA polymerase sigma factor [Pirellulales bacterium]
MAYILSLVPNWHDARDIAQETRLQLWRKFDQYDPSKSFGPWALTIAHWQVKRFRTERGRDRLTFSDEAIEQFASQAAEASTTTDDRQAALATCVERLDAVKRKLLSLYVAGEMKVRDIAQQQGRSYESVRKSIFRTRVELRECVERVMGKEAGQ